MKNKIYNDVRFNLKYNYTEESVEALEHDIHYAPEALKANDYMRQKNGTNTTSGRQNANLNYRLNNFRAKQVKETQYRVPLNLLDPFANIKGSLNPQHMLTLEITAKHQR